LSGVDVRAAVRRTRLPFVASLFLAALLGAPMAAAAPAVAPVRASVTVAHAAVPTAAHRASAELRSLVAVPASARATLAVALPDVPALGHQAVRAAVAPRAPPLG
jgi:Skp family chaperone for outer membrane proteins